MCHFSRHVCDLAWKLFFFSDCNSDYFLFTFCAVYESFFVCSLFLFYEALCTVFQKATLSFGKYTHQVKLVTFLLNMYNLFSNSKQTY